MLKDDLGTFSSTENRAVEDIKNFTEKLNLILDEAIKVIEIETQAHQAKIKRLEEMTKEKDTIIEKLDQTTQRRKQLQIKANELIIPIVEQTGSQSIKNLQIAPSKPVAKDPSLILKSYFLNEMRIKVDEVIIEPYDSLLRSSSLNLSTHGNIKDSTTKLTNIAVKNPKSFLIGSLTNGLILIENNELVYNLHLTEDRAPYRDMIYADHLECYFFYHAFHLYRKDINKESPYVCMDLRCGSRPGAYLRYSALNQRLIINKKGKNISVVNLEKKEIEIEVEKQVGNNIWDFKVLGRAEDMVTAITKYGYLLVYKLDFEHKTGSVMTHQKIDTIPGREEQGTSIAASEDGDFILVEIGQYFSPRVCSRMALFKLDDGVLIRMATLDQFSLKIGYKSALEFLGCFEGYFVWVGLSSGDGGYVQIYYLNSKTGEFRELDKRRVGHHEISPYRIHRVGKRFYYTGKTGMIMSLYLRV